MIQPSPRIEQFLKPLDGNPLGEQVRSIIQDTLAQSATDPTAHGRAEIQAIAARTFQLWDSVPGMVGQTNVITGCLREADLELRKAGWFLLSLPVAVPTDTQRQDPDWSPYDMKMAEWITLRTHPLVAIAPKTITALMQLAQGRQTFLSRQSNPPAPECLRPLLAKNHLNELNTACELTGLTALNRSQWVLDSLLAAREHLLNAGRRFLLMNSFRLYRPLGFEQFPQYVDHCALTETQVLFLICLYRNQHDFNQVVRTNLTEVR